jgi:hypothetical protein
MDRNKLVELFEHAIETKNPDEVDDAVSATFSIIKPESFVSYLCQLLESSWHFDHEDITRLLQKIGDPESVNVLFKTAIKKFDYLEYDDSKSLSRKCTWALADIGNSKSKEALIELAKNQDKEIAGFAQKRIDNWEKEIERKKHFG